MTDGVILERFAYSPHGTFGRLRVGNFACYTVERPWKDNRVRESCIPEGEYALQLGRYHRGGYPAYEVLGVPGRTLIKIHIGNTIDDVVGCIAPGQRLGYLRNKWAVISSRATFAQFMAAMDGRERSWIEITRMDAGVLGDRVLRQSS
jgi:hypothetical protein